MLGSDLAAISVQAEFCVQEELVQHMLFVKSAAAQTPIQPLYSAVLSHARNKSNAARNTYHWQGQIKLHFLFIEAHCVLFRVSIESYKYAFYSLSIFHVP